MAVEQIRVGRDNFSYLVYCKETRLAALVDPGMDTTKAIERIRELNLDLKFIINTHHHADHTAENSRVKKEFHSKIIAYYSDKSNHDIGVKDREEFVLGNTKLKFLHTPGHTPGNMCIIVNNKYILTGDTLFIGDCGRTDLPGGSNVQMFETLQMIKSLPDELIIMPGHDYGDAPQDTLGNQKCRNKVLLAQTLEEFSRIP